MTDSKTRTEDFDRGATTGGMAKTGTPPEDMFCKDLNAISIVQFLEGNRKERKKVGLNQGTKRLLSRVLALSQDGDCYASDEYLARWLGASVPSVQRWIKEAKGYGILDVKQIDGHRHLSVNAGKLRELKFRYLAFLKAEKSRWRHGGGGNADVPPFADQVDRQADKDADQPEGGDGQVDESEHQPDDRHVQPDTLIDNKSESSGSREESDNNAVAEQPATAALSLLSCRLNLLREQESTKKAEIEECRRSLDAIDAGLGLYGDVTRDGTCRELKDRLEELTSAIADIQIVMLDVTDEVAKEQERLKCEAERQRIEAERLKREVELDSWKHDPEHRIVEDPSMVLDAFQSACRHRFPSSTLMFPSRENQVRQAADVLQLLRDQGSLDEVVLRSWVLWYPQKCLNADSPAHHITIRWLLESWRRFRKKWPVPRASTRADAKRIVLDLRRETAPVTGFPS